MPKSTKKKKEKDADFTKAKLKLGKGKQPASNAVDTSFKARSIVLPQQSITVSKNEAIPTTKRGLALDDLLSQLKHYSPSVRKDAIRGLNELLEENRSLATSNLLKLVNACARLIGDEDMMVRKALHTFLGWLLTRVSQDALAPHVPTLLVFTSSAMTHIFPEIRIDAIRVLDLLLDYFPQHAIEGVFDGVAAGSGQSHGRKLLDGYLNLLSVSARLHDDEQQRASSSSAGIGQTVNLVTLSAASKTTILKSFAKFLLHASSSETRAGAHDTSIPLWYLKTAFKSEEAYESFVELLALRRSSPDYGVPRIFQDDIRLNKDLGYVSGHYPLCDIANGALQDLTNLEQTVADINQFCRVDGAYQTRETSGTQLIIQLCRILRPVLISLILDCAPSVFSPTQSSSEAEQELLLAALEIARCLYGRLLRDGSLSSDRKDAAGQELSTLLGQMVVYFPFGENRMIALDSKTERTFEQMNLIYCELFSLRSLASELPVARPRGMIAPRKRQKLNHGEEQTTTSVSMARANLDNQVSRVREHVIRCLRGQPSLGVGESVRPLGRALTVQMYTALLPTLWWLVNEPGNSSSEVLQAILEHATKCGSASGVKTAATELVARMVLVQAEPSYVGVLRFGSGSIGDKDLHDALQAWLLHLPKVLWEIGDKNAAMSELILLFLLRLMQHRLWLYNTETSVALCTRLQPFFMMQHATRGELRGPYQKLAERPSTSALASTKCATAPLKRLALDVAAALMSDSLLGPPSQSSRNRRAPPHRGLMASRPAFGSMTESGSGSASESASFSGAGTASASRSDTRTALLSAVEKATIGTPEADYWRGILDALTC